MDENNLSVRPTVKYTFSLTNIAILLTTFLVFLFVGFVIGSYYQQPVENNRPSEIVVSTTEESQGQQSDINGGKDTEQKIIVQKEFELGSYKGGVYKLVWKEIPVDDDKDLADNPDSMSNWSENVSLVTINTNGTKIVKSNSLFTLKGGRFRLPCNEDLTTATYFPETIKAYMDICSVLQPFEVFVTQSAGWTSARLDYIINLEYGTIESKL